MTDDETRFELSRRKALAALGSVGVASAGAGLGTTAFFSDVETFGNNSLTAGELDLTVAVQQHYVDWLGDEADDATMDGSPNLVLNPGDVDANDGDGDDARAIELDVTDPLGLAVGSSRNTINGGVPPQDLETSLCDEPTFQGRTIGGDDDPPQPIVQLDDVKPGDFGLIRFAFASCDNPAFVSLIGNLTDSDEGGYTEPEEEDPDEDGPENEDTVELLDYVQLAVVPFDAYQALEAVASGNEPGPLTVNPQATLRDLEDGGKIPVDLDPASDGPGGVIPAEEGGGVGDRACFEGRANFRGTLIWWLPVDHANQVQTDSATFELGIYAEQCRHNDGTTDGGDVTQSVDISPANVSGNTGDHVVDITVGSEDDGEPLSKIDIDYDAFGASNPGGFLNDIKSLTLNGTDISGQIDGTSQAAGGRLLEIRLDGSSSLSAGDTISLQYGGVQDPSSGTATVTINGDNGTSDSWGNP